MNHGVLEIWLFTTMKLLVLQMLHSNQTLHVLAILDINSLQMINLHVLPYVL